MKKQESCTKCQGTDILRIEGSGQAYGNTIPVGITIFGMVKVTRYLCFDCGFSEEWVDDYEDLRKLKEKFG